MVDRDFILAPQTATVTVALEPVYNALTSFMLLASVDSQSGFNDWVVQTAARFSPEQYRVHRLIFDSMGLLSAVLPDESWPDFDSFFADLHAKSPEAMRDQAIKWLWVYEPEIMESIDQKTLISDLSVYLNAVEQHYAKRARGDIDRDFYTELHRLFNQPRAIKDMIISHVKYLWHEVMLPEWGRIKPMLQEAVDAFQQLDFSQLTALEAARRITGRDLSNIYEKWGEKIIFVPSAHIGPYVMRFDSDTQSVSWLVFGARLPEGARAKSPALSRSELLVQLNALADDTRLRILELLTEHAELCAQDIITILDLSQSSASRHLRQLTASGYLTERRREVSKCYSLNLERVDNTLTALKKFLQNK